MHFRILEDWDTERVTFNKVPKFRAWGGVVVQKVKEFDNLSLIAGVHMVERESLLQRAGL